MKELNPEDQTLIRQYLLGDLSEDEQAQVQDRLLSDREFFNELLIAENELTDDYLGGALASHEVEKFRSYFLAAPDRRQKLRVARALSRYVSTSAPADSPDLIAASRVSWWRSLAAFLRFQGAKAVFTAIGLLGIAGAVWLAVETSRLRNQLEQARAAQSESERRRQELEQELSRQKERSQELARYFDQVQSHSANLEQQVAGLKQHNQAWMERVVSFVLIPGLVRDEGAPNKVEIPRGATRLRLQLSLVEAKHESYRARLRTAEGRDVWSRKNLKALRRTDDSVVEVRLPAGLLPDDDYVLLLRGATASGDYERAGTYSFRVLRK